MCEGLSYFAVEAARRPVLQRRVCGDAVRFATRLHIAQVLGSSPVRRTLQATEYAVVRLVEGQLVKVATFGLVMLLHLHAGIDCLGHQNIPV